jgi:threonylcarbamoyladenosine tRNA methylthiotransferase MtaB
MKRRHSRADALRLIAAVRAARPDAAFGADLIAGFPTETEAMFENTLSLVDDAGLSYLHVFPFSARPETPAARMPAVPRQLVKDRAERLRAAGGRALTAHLDARVGRTMSALIEREGRGRAADFTEIAFEGAAEPGRIVALRIIGHDGRSAISQGPEGHGAEG